MSSNTKMVSRSAGRGAAGRRFPLVEYVLLTQFGLLLQWLGIRKRDHLTVLHWKVAEHGELSYGELKLALTSAVKTWFAFELLSILVLAPFAFIADAFEGGRMNKVTEVVFTILFTPALFAIAAKVITMIRLRALGFSAQMFRRVPGAVRVRRYRPKRWDIWVALVFTALIIGVMASTPASGR